ncbi:PREDICTED: sister chromatid cohesion protein PDS5 homolog A-like [Tarenaya hassleriana]|uniref:sister chromatid cohesion protein PDS5 homolog A-like n=1 Tax=Tarenaya hassleriana TaxID=28532 RepID=UPI00053C7C9B|nr:PREDICTED: sister chromatid cohesion protein PDS5 homolog A-like [Tarenaya hassleriana]
MAQKPEEQLKEVGSKLDPPPSSKDALLELLKQAADCLSEFDQSPPAPVMNSMQPFLDAVVKPEILKHQDKDVELLVASCISEITRITAPEAPYGDNIMKDIFQLIVSTFGGLNDNGSPSLRRRVVILETVAKYRSCVVMLDLECNDLVTELFTTLFAVARDDHPENILSSMQNIMVVLLEESEDVQEHLLLITLSKLGRNRSDITAAARKLAIKVIEQCAPKLESDIKQFLITSMSGESRLSNSQIDYHEVIYDLYRCAPQTLAGVAPYLMGELLADQLETRLKVVELVGDLFSLPGSACSEEFRLIFLEFLKRLSDRAVEVRMSILEHIRSCLLSDPSREEASQIISTLCDRLLDYDENIRKQVVAVICDVAANALGLVQVDTIKLVAERLRDKAALVKKYTLERLADLFKVYCQSCADGKVCVGEFDWIPGKILRCFYDKDFRSDTIEHILCNSLFPSDFTIRDKVKCWVQVFTGFDTVERKALEKILEQKQRIQQEMQKYLSFRQMEQDVDVPEIQKKILFCFRMMSRTFSDPPKAEQNFQILAQLKDANIWKILSNLLDHDTSIMEASKHRNDVLKIISEQHRLYDFLVTLSIKCSYLLFNKEHVKEILAEVSARKSAQNPLSIQSCMSLLGILASFCPSLFIGVEAELISFLKDDDETTKEGALKILAKAGGTIRENLTVSSSSVDLMLERICVEGSRMQAKYAVLALASITKDDGLKSLSVLYKRLVDMLEDKTHLPAVLQCLGCIAQIAVPVFETREAEVVEFIKSKILKCKSEAVGDKNSSWDDKTELCRLKIYGIKTLVKSYLPFNDAHLRAGVDDLLGLLKNILSFGEVSEDIESSSNDKSHLRLDAAKAVLRLSRHWEDKIPMDVFHLTLKTPKILFPMARKIFLGKVHQYVMDRLLDVKYACSFLFDLAESKVLESDEGKQNLADIIQLSYQSKARQISAQPDTTSANLYPEYILPYLVHMLAHHSCPDIDKCRDVKEYEMIYRQLYLIISMLLCKEDDGKSEDNTKEPENVPTIISIFQSIKQSEDVMDATKSKNSRAICELGLSIVKRLTEKELDLQGMAASVSLPPTLFKPYKEKESGDSQVCEEHIWLADETVLAHFKSLKLENDASVTPEAAEAEDIKDGESDGNEVPLGKIVERLKSQGTKGGRAKKNKPLPAEAENGENDVDILKMVREINLDQMGMLNKFESSNGQKQSPDKRAGTDQGDKNANKRKAGDETSVISVPKRRRSSSGHIPFKFSNTSPKFRQEDSKDEFQQERDISWDTNDQISGRKKGMESTSSLKKKKGLSSDLKTIGSDWGFSDEENESKGADHIERKQSKLARSGDNILKSASGSMQNQKRKSISGLAECPLKENKPVADELIGCRIKVWWPLDKRFYEGMVKSHDPTKHKHVILYDDGDVEVLHLEKERWELVDMGRKATKKLNSLKNSPHKRRSAESKHKHSDGSWENKDPITTTPKRKRTPKKNLRHKQEGTSRSLSAEAEKEERADKKNNASAMSYVSPGKAAETMDGNPTDREESKGKSGNEEETEECEKKKDLQGEEAESSASFRGDETEVDKSESEDMEEKDEIETGPENHAGDTDISDNETLGAWKLKVCKANRRKAT